MTAPPPSEYERRRRTSEGHVEQESGYDGPEEYKQDSDRRVAGHGLCVGRTNQISENDQNAHPYNDQNAHPYVGDRPVHVSSSTLKHRLGAFGDAGATVQNVGIARMTGISSRTQSRTFLLRAGILG